MSAVLYGSHFTREQDLRVGRQLQAWWTSIHPLRNRVQFTLDGRAATTAVVLPQIGENGIVATGEDDPFTIEKLTVPDDAQWLENRAAMVRAIMSSAGVSSENN